MKKIYTLFLAVFILTLSGCGATNQSTNQVSPANIKSETQLNSYKSKLISVEYPQGYEARESSDMLIVSNSKGKIIIGGFRPSVGYPEADKKDFPFREITYTKDPKAGPDAIPAALYFRYGDTKTETELIEILKTVKNLP